MKRFFPIILGALIGIGYSFTADAQGISSKGKKVQFLFPDSLSESKSILFPTFQSLSSAYATTVQFDVEEFYTYLDVDTMTGNLTLNAVPTAQLTPGAFLFIRTIANDDGRTVVFGSHLEAPNMTTDSLSHRMNSFIYTGSTFRRFGNCAND
jgi:hypothetical protein